ncbi:MAG: hypothetical protein AAF411_08265 [Myxococcota bacterium]
MPAPSRVLARDVHDIHWRLPRPLRGATRSFAEALFWSDAGAPDSKKIAWLLDELEDYLGRSGVRAQLVFQASMTAITTLAPLTLGRPLPLNMLTPHQRAEAIEHFEQTPLGLSVLAAKTMLCLIWYEHPDIQADVDIDTACAKDVNP